MTDEYGARSDAAEQAAKRLTEIEDLFQEIRTTLQQMRASLKGSSDLKPKDLLNKLSELQSAHLKVVSAEDSYHDKIGKNLDEDAIDFDAIRAEIGRQLDRLRESLLAEGFPCDTDTRSTCNAALPLRFLGDAASDTAEG